MVAPIPRRAFTPGLFINAIKEHNPVNAHEPNFNFRLGAANSKDARIEQYPSNIRLHRVQLSSVLL